jgi:hypothetical protein
MVRLRFFNLEPPAAVDLDAAAFLFDRDQVLRLPERVTIGVHVRNFWRIGPQDFTRLEVPHTVRCRFHRDAAIADVLGPFRSLQGVDGVIMGDETPLARFAEHRWRSLAGPERSWLGFQVEPLEDG